MGDNLLLGMLFITITAFSQVGVNTTNPLTTLDINGNLAIRTVPVETNKDIAKDSILVISTDGIVKTISANDVVNKGIPSIAKGNFSASGAIAVSLLTGSSTIPFDNESFDLSNEYDTSSYTFTALEDGIYQVYVQIETHTTIGTATNFGVSIRHNGSVIATSSFANVGVLGVNVTPPFRNTSTFIQVTAGDTINFSLEGDIALGTVNLSGDGSNSFFTINQIR
ncbi:complement C1q domain-containing protein [Aureisphaera sp. CAU 1614]|uniref:Complement C1q domain-containing protein n=1 Tax=Halomarinibacterium sedimenti TaxID=2857106 RepID=A0A9X1FP96_9FLAO|nr:complement C1q domain-containing protein [Halomarinibacterium sedimenti]MBW2937574.1 complement C1q domain-containing protein [Halomarinibacterium sedimenti]